VVNLTHHYDKILSKSLIWITRSEFYWVFFISLGDFARLKCVIGFFWDSSELLHSELYLNVFKGVVLHKDVLFGE